MTTPIPPSVPTPDKIETPFGEVHLNYGFPDSDLGINDNFMKELAGHLSPGGGGRGEWDCPLEPLRLE